MDVAEVVKQRYMEAVKVKRIDIGTDMLSLKEGGQRPISRIEIVLTT